MMRLSAAPCILACLVLLGCQNQTLAPSAGLGDPYPAPLNDPQITVLSPELRQWILFHPARIEADGEKPMQVEVPVRNIAGQQYLIDYRILFYDDDDLELTPTMGWTFAALGPKQTVRLKAGALSPEAINYRLEIKWAR